MKNGTKLRPWFRLLSPASTSGDDLSRVIDVVWSMQSSTWYDRAVRGDSCPETFLRGKLSMGTIDAGLKIGRGHLSTTPFVTGFARLKVETWRRRRQSSIASRLKHRIKPENAATMRPKRSKGAN